MMTSRPSGEVLTISNLHDAKFCSYSEFADIREVDLQATIHCRHRSKREEEKLPENDATVGKHLGFFS